MCVIRLASDCYVFFLKQRTAYVMRISDWSSDVCSSDLGRRHPTSASIPMPYCTNSATTRPRSPACAGAAPSERRVFVRLEFGRRHSYQIGGESCRERACQYV